jgi:hypothetical protein
VTGLPVNNRESPNSSLIVCWILASVVKSILEVASSRMIMELRRSSARANAINCLDRRMSALCSSVNIHSLPLPLREIRTAWRYLCVEVDSHLRVYIGNRAARCGRAGTTITSAVPFANRWCSGCFSRRPLGLVRALGNHLYSVQDVKAVLVTVLVERIQVFLGAKLSHKPISCWSSLTRSDPENRVASCGINVCE